ncbi:DUF4232 domain-containing protein [Streptomyces longispororuber]|uniref:DUF4232 domain-containing protein n=1 Tax=Streptomyces longispororuber TaxID=68230 RepID=UPI00210CC118|nr:DUF4232 domain-containing protein [Streptomyces longispororuber]MCQ4214528.1 DUF4232 domain-containing protein [Streptomyces longispororuber]
MNKTTIGTRPGRRHVSRTVLAGAAVVAALLGSTACQPDDRTNAHAPTSASATATPSQAGPTAKASPSTADSGTGTGTGDSSKGTGKNGDSGETGGGNGTSYPDCGPEDLSALSAEPRTPADGSKNTFYALSLTNRSQRKCAINEYPQVWLNDKPGSTSSVQPDKDTADDETLVLAPGDTAWAGLRTAKGPYDEGSTDTFVVRLISGEGTDTSHDFPAVLGKPAVVSDGARVGYWAGTEGLALRPMSD